MSAKLTEPKADASLWRRDPSLKLQLAAQKRCVWCHDVPVGVTLSDCLRPDYWEDCIGKLGEWDLIELLAHDKSWWQTLVVLSVVKGGVAVHIAH